MKQLLLVVLSLFVVGCVTKAPLPESPPPVVAKASPGPAEPPGWRYITSTSDEMRLISSSPAGDAFLMSSNIIGDPRQDLLVTVGDRITVEKLAPRRVVTETPAHWRADFLDLPWGTVALEAGSDRGNEGGVISPDRRYAVVSGDGLWLANLTTGEARQLTSARPEQWPATLGVRQPLGWAVDPRWSADSKWVYFQSNRLPPHAMTWWRVPVDGGVEEPAEAPPESKLDRFNADGFFGRSLSPDGKWFAADKTESPTFRIYNLEQPSATLTYTHAPGWYAGASGGWAPDSSKVLFHALPQYGLAGFMGVYDVKAGGKATLFAFPDLLAGRPVAVGFVGTDRVLVSMRPWNAEYSDTQWPSEIQWWLLDLKSVPPLAPAEPSRLLAARLLGQPGWQQTGKVTGGETVLALDGPLMLRFDRTVSPEWLQANVLVAGAGA
ncbi:MAG TPA: hypothetical protein VNT75_28460, partial [Symbiobacteriaceae bacterium]|nr:hypothetical protein [Symbiobacteriaceae bacterium]